MRASAHYRGYQRCSGIDYADSENVFFLTLCVAPRRAVFVTAECNQVLVGEIRRLQDEAMWGAYLYCLMTDHIHLVVSPGTEGLPAAVRSLKGRFAAWWRQHGDGYPLWQDGYFDHRLRSGESFTEKCRYVMMNPVRAGLATQPDQFRWLGSFAVYTGR
ncbi:MAG: transposase [Verrucomicrobiota bacterium]